MKGVVYYEALKHGRTLNADVYCKQSDTSKVFRFDKQKKMLFFGMAMQGPVLQKKTKKEIRRLGCEILLWPQYSPNLAPTDFHLFRSLEHLISVRRSRNKEDWKEFFERFFLVREETLVSLSVESKICLPVGQQSFKIMLIYIFFWQILFKFKLHLILYPFR